MLNTTALVRNGTAAAAVACSHCSTMVHTWPVQHAKQGGANEQEPRRHAPSTCTASRLGICLCLSQQTPQSAA